MTDAGHIFDIRSKLGQIEDTTRETRYEVARISGAIERDVRGDIKVAALAAEKIAEKRSDKVMARLDTITLMVLGSNIAFLILLIFTVVLQLYGGGR